MVAWIDARFAVAVALFATLVPGPLLAAGLAPGSSALLFDVSNGRVLYSEDPDQPWYAASLTKMMTAYVMFEAWQQGSVGPADKITISPYANGQPKMRLGLGVGKQISFDDASKALIMESANDIAVAIGEAVSGTEAAFVDRMNETAKRLSMYGTRYINPHGLPGEGQYTTAKDLSLLATALVRDFPQHLSLFAMTETQIGKRRIATHNPVLSSVPGGDGLKTGFTCSAGYNIVASASRNGQRMVAIVLGAATKEKRALRAAQLLDFGFARGAWKSLDPAIPDIASLPETKFDRQAMRALNLDKRYVDCRDPVPELIIAAADLPTTAAAPGTVALATMSAAAAALTAPPELKTASAAAGKAKTHRLQTKKHHTKRKNQPFE